jgi:hypothetical protein
MASGSRPGNADLRQRQPGRHRRGGRRGVCRQSCRAVGLSPRRRPHGLLGHPRPSPPRTARGDRTHHRVKGAANDLGRQGWAGHRRRDRHHLDRKPFQTPSRCPDHGSCPGRGRQDGPLLATSSRPYVLAGEQVPTWKMGQRLAQSAAAASASRKPGAGGPPGPRSRTSRARFRHPGVRHARRCRSAEANHVARRTSITPGVLQRAQPGATSSD